MKAISSLELAKVVSELQELVNSRVKKIYQVERRLVFELYLGKKVCLLLEAGKRIHTTTYSEEKPKNPPGFCTLLRKRLGGTRLTGIGQHGFDRVVVLRFEGKETYHIVAELFAKGNIILCDSEMKIVQPLKVEFWSSRSVKPKTGYVFPPPGPNLLEMDGKKFSKFLKSGKKNLVSMLVSSGLGKEGERICDMLELPRDVEASKLSDADVDMVWKDIKKVLGAIQDSEGLNSEIDRRFAEGIGEELEGEEEQAEERAKIKWEKRKNELEDAIEDLQRRIKESKEVGKWIQANNIEVQSILDGAKKDLKAGMGRPEVEKKYGVTLEGEKLIIQAE